MVERRMATCHPERVLAAKGLCWTCYEKAPRKRHGPKWKEDLVLPEKQDGILTIEDLVRVVGDTADIPYSEAKKAVLTIFGSMIKALKLRDYVYIRGIGRWLTYVRPEQTIYAINWGGGWRTYPERVKVRFKPDAFLKYHLNPERTIYYAEQRAAQRAEWQRLQDERREALRRGL